MRLTTYDMAILGLRPLAYYPLGELGSIARNIAPSFASLDGASTGTVKRGQAPLLPNGFLPSTSYDGTSGGFITPTGVLNAALANVSVACWMNSPLTVAYGRLCSTNEVSASQAGFELNEGSGPGSDFEFFWTIATGITTLGQIGSGANTNLANKLYFVVGTYDGANMRLYVNGVQANSAAYTGTIGAASAMRIGQDGAGFGFYEGRMSRLAVWNKNLTAAQVLELYRLGLSPEAKRIAASTLLPAVIPAQAGGFWSSAFGSPNRSN